MSAPTRSVQAVHIELECLQDGAIELAGGRYRAVLEVAGVARGLQADADHEALHAAFGGLLNGLTHPVQLLIRSMPMDLDDHAARFEAAGGDHCPGLEQLARAHAAFLRQLGRRRTLLDRRFYVVVPAKDEAPTRLPGWLAGLRGLLGRHASHADGRSRDEIARQLTFRTDEIAAQLARCGATARRLDDLAVAQLLHACWSPERARTQRLRHALADYLTPVVRGQVESRPAEGPRFVGSGADAPAARFERGLRRVADLVAPASCEVGPSALRLDGQYARVLALTAYPRSVGPGWLDPLIYFEGPLEISLHITPLDSAAVARSLGQKLVDLQSSRLFDARRERLADPEREVAFEDAERLRDQLSRREERVFSVSVYILLRAPTQRALDELTRRLERCVDGMLAQSRVLLLEQDTGFRACLPQATDEPATSRNLDTSSLATMFPFTSTTVAMDRGVLLGVNVRTQTPVLVDPFDLQMPNANMVVFAASGAGKSYFTKLLVLRGLLAGIDCAIIDPEDEYRAVCDAVGGQAIRLASTTHRQHLNPLDLPAAESASGGDPLAEHVASRGALLEVLLGGTLSQAERTLLDRALYATYEAAGITAETGTWRRPMPLLRDLHAVLEQLGRDSDTAQGLAARLGRFVSGSFASGLFAGPTNVQLDSRCVVFDTRALDRELRPLAVHLVADVVHRREQGSLRPRLLIGDEIWSLLQHAEGGAFAGERARRSRKRYAGLVAISQDIADCLGSVHGRAILANAATKLLLQQDSTTIDVVADACKLSDAERRFLLGARRGEGLLFVGGTRLPLQIEADASEHALITTNPRELADRHAEQAGAPSRSRRGGAPETLSLPFVADARTAQVTR